MATKLNQKPKFSKSQKRKIKKIEKGVKLIKPSKKPKNKRLSLAISDGLSKFHKHQRQLKYVKGGAHGSIKALRARNILDICLLRMLRAKIPNLSGYEDPPLIENLSYGLKDVNSGNLIKFAEPLSAKKAKKVDFIETTKETNIFTDGSFRKSSNINGYAVVWEDYPQLLSYGRVDVDGVKSSAQAEEYAILLALLEIRAIYNPKIHYCIKTDALWVKQDVLYWCKKWSKVQCPIGWKTPPNSRTVHNELLRVAGGVLWDLRFRGVQVTVEYIKGHSGFAGNEVADFYAKRAVKTNETAGFVPKLVRNEESLYVDSDTDSGTDLSADTGTDVETGSESDTRTATESYSGSDMDTESAFESDSSGYPDRSDEVEYIDLT